MKSESQTAMSRLLSVMERLRGQNGCPWDREQTLDSIKQYLVEETYETLDAIDAKDARKHMEELGDLLLQVVFQSQIRKEEGSFTFDDVVNALVKKLTRRHPHVFGDVRVSGSREVLQNWHAIKAEERKSDSRLAFEQVPRHLPALRKAQEVQTRAARVGFDWENRKQVVKKVEEEMTELKQSLDAEDAGKISMEIGDLLFAVVNLCRFCGVNAEDALSAAVSKFMRRLKEVERRIGKQGRKLADCTLKEMDACWEAVKECE